MRCVRQQKGGGSEKDRAEVHKHHVARAGSEQSGASL